MSFDSERLLEDLNRSSGDLHGSFAQRKDLIPYSTDDGNNYTELRGLSVYRKDSASATATVRSVSASGVSE